MTGSREEILSTLLKTLPSCVAARERSNPWTSSGRFTSCQAPVKSLNPIMVKCHVAYFRRRLRSAASVKNVTIVFSSLHSSFWNLEKRSESSTDIAFARKEVRLLMLPYGRMDVLEPPLDWAVDPSCRWSLTASRTGFQ